MTRFDADRWPYHVRLSDLEHKFIGQACGKPGVDFRADFTEAPTPRQRAG
jgi:hypothetical protein